MLENVHWMGHSAFKITGKKVIYFDPYEIPKGETADIILVTHGHYDHFSPNDIGKIEDEKTIIIVPKSAEISVSGDVRKVTVGDKLEIDEIKILVVPAYNIGKRFHPKEREDVGYVVTSEGVTYYHAGDTDRIPEMTEIQTDVAFLPVGGTYTMDAKAAAQAAKDVHAKVAVPMHWGSIVGSKKEAETFKELCECEAEILEKEK